MPQELKTQFEFELGEIVYFRNAANDLESPPKPYIVQEQIAARCPGGIQQFYALNNGERVMEICLQRDPPKYRPADPERLKDLASIADARDTFSRRVRYVDKDERTATSDTP